MTLVLTAPAFRVRFARMWVLGRYYWPVGSSDRAELGIGGVSSLQWLRPGRRLSYQDCNMSRLQLLHRLSAQNYKMNRLQLLEDETLSS